jgi:hypothetical protein
MTMAKSKRKSMSKTVRFEVFKRDSFTCQYCGLKAPEVVLHVDHIHPVSKGGDNDLLNLVTSCSACNSGKSDKTLSDKSVVEKQRRQLEELQEKREQIDMMLQWQQELIGLSDHVVDQVCSLYDQVFPGWSLNDNGQARVRAAIGEISLHAVLEELRASTKFLRFEGGKPTAESVRIATDAFLNSCKYRKARERDPVGSELRYIRGIMRNRYAYAPLDRALETLTRGHKAGISTGRLREIVMECRNWTQWCDAMKSEVSQATAEE